MTIKNKNKNKISGYSILELVLAVFTSSIVLLGAYSAYTIVAEQFKRNNLVSEIKDFALPTIRLISRDLRLAGYKEVDANIESLQGNIANPITINDSGTAICCDNIQIIYDKSISERVRISYFVANRTNPERKALFMNVETYNGSTWDMQTQNAIVTDYIEDFQVEGKNFNSLGQPKLVSFSLIFRSRNKVNTAQNFQKPDYQTGNFIFTANDNYLREAFETSVRLRNIAE